MSTQKENKNKKYNINDFKEVFIKLNKDDSGIWIVTDKDFNLTPNDVFFNHITNLTIIEYKLKGKINHSKAFFDDHENIKIFDKN